MKRLCAFLKDLWDNPLLPPGMLYQRMMIDLSLRQIKLEQERKERRKRVLEELDKFWIDA